MCSGTVATLPRSAPLLSLSLPFEPDCFYIFLSLLRDGFPLKSGKLTKSYIVTPTVAHITVSAVVVGGVATPSCARRCVCVCVPCPWSLR